MGRDPGEDELLLCVLVRQQQLLSDEQLECVLSQWLDAPERPLIDAVAEAARLSSGQTAHLRATVERQSAETESDRRGSRIRTLPAGVRELISSVGERSGAATRKPFETLPHDPTRPAPPRDAPATTPGNRFEVLQVHAQGGLGVVYLARDREIDRTVALKQIRSKYADDENSRARFLLEARVTGRLEHPNVAPVYALGADETGRPYYAMRLIRGESLLDVIDRFHHGRQATTAAAKRMPELRKLLQRFLDVCNAIDYAHSKGVIHRDIKPANIFASQRGGIYDVAKLLDFGLVKEGGDAAGGTQGSFSGTPHYMSPEQASAYDEVDGRADIYSLGAVAYQLVTGRTPFEGENVVELLSAHLFSPVPPPSEWNTAIPVDLDHIILRCLAKKPAERFQSAADLAEALDQCSLAGQWGPKRAALWWNGAKDSRQPSQVPTMVATLDFQPG